MLLTTESCVVEAKSDDPPALPAGGMGGMGGMM
jgi:hypothetical protein